MIKLGIFRSKHNSYACYYFPDTNKVECVGPLHDGVGSSDVAFEANAVSEEKARNIIRDTFELGKIN